MDSDGQDSDEGIVITEDNHHALQGQPPVEANIVYALLPKNVPVHRVARLRWWLDRINTVAALPEETQEPPADIQIISFIPSAQKAIITNKTEVIFLAQSYRFVYCLDMSPSLSTVDVNKGGILLSEVLERFKSSLGCICRRFIIPGSRTVFQPDIYVTVMVNTPFFMSPAQQVLVKGVRVDWKNLNKIIGLVESQFGVLDQKIAQVSALAHDQLEQQRVENDGIVGGLFDLHENEKRLPNIPMVVPDANFVNMLRYSMLAITLLPENSLSHILVISDGVVAMPDSKIMESLLLQLHFDGTALSFLKVGSPFSPNVSATYVPYMDLLYFLSQATLGTCIEDFTYVQGDNLNFNIYHELFLFWSFYGRARQTCVKATKAEKVWNPVNRPPALLSKKQSEGKINAPICLLLARRLREGYVIDSVNNINGYLEIKLSLLWKNYVYLNYKLTSQWPDTKIATHFEIHILAPYEFLHDITCRMKKELKSTYRQALIDRFWIRITQLANGDTDFAQHLTTVAHSNTWYTLPESVRSGIPVFLLNSTSHDALKLVLTPSDTSCPKFYNFWLPICQMETNSWRKWFHTSKFSLILKHDHPLPKHLHLANSSGRFQVVQSRQAASALYGMLANWAAFVLIDNHTYIKFLYLESDKLIWFCIIRVNCKFPCIVLNLGFLTGTPTHIRQKVCESIKEKLSTLSYQSSPPNPKETVCCTLLNKPLEKILIRYERMPSDFTTVIFPDGTQPPHTLQTLPKSPFAGTLFTTLSRYLYHRRWIWSATHSPHLRLDYSACSRILSTLTRMRLEEGFAIAYSSSGIITMVLELEMEPCGTCVVQYVLFPPHSAAKDEEDICSGSEEDVETDSELELQMVTEVWIEPQYGKAHTENQRLLYMKDRQYFNLADMLSQIDSRCIHSLLTLEHLSLMCQDKRVHRLNLNSRLGKYPKTVSPSPSEVSDATAPLNTQRIHLVPFRFDPLSILSLCRMTELLFSMFIESRHSANELFVENVLLQFDMIHDHELPLDGDESEQVTEHLMRRNCNESVIGKSNAKWRCFIKGISVTHVILTFVPASLTDLKVLTDYKKEFLRGSSAGSDCSEISSSNSPVLPVYLFDCQLSLLLDTYLSSNNDVTSKDVYLDYRFKFWNCDGKDTKNDDQEDTKSNSSQHFRSLTLTFSKCFMLSLFTALHRELYVHFCDVEAAVKQCEETIEEIDMTDFILGLCGHVKEQTEEIIHLEKQLGKSPCIDLKYMEAVIQKKWFSTIGVAFTPIPTKPEYYFCRDLLAESKLNEHEKESDDGLYYNTNIDSKKSVPLRYDTSGAESIRNVLSPLFLHFSYTLVYNNNIIGKKDFRFLPTCLVEILRDMKIEENSIERSKLKLTLNLTCLTLPNLIQNVSEELTGSKSQISVGIHSNNKTKAQQEFRKLHELQLVSISNLKKELIWLLKDEIITSLLDVQPVTTNSLHVITKHIAENTSRPSCIVDTIGLNFVYERADSFEKFVDEFERLSVPNYVICKQEDVYYLAKEKKERLESGCYFSPVVEENKAMVESEDEAPNKHSSESSEASSLMPSEGGYEEDISENEEEYDWIYTYEQKRPYLPNFWLIMQADKKSVTIYYHCRFMEFPAMTASYINMEKNVGEAISDLCKRVNQSLLLQSLDETRKCNALLEPDDNVNEWSMESMKRTPSLIRYLKGLDESNEEGECLQNESKFKPGYFSCPVVWETRFGLHPRLKVGPGKSGISRGILALKNILEKFSVSNRDNMFVYRDRNSNVFYLRLHENLQSCSTRSLKSGDLDHSVVSRSPSIASLPLGQKSNFLHSFEQASSPSAVVDVRPRVRSFGEKESNEPAVEDKLILKVHGITEAGEDVKYDLKDVLQNRLDDAVLEFLSIMLARNAMCPLTPEDVHFLQKPFKPPEMVIKISIQDFVLSKLDAFHLYLRQNLLQFLNIPKYTDTRPLFHFTDYSETDQVSKNKDDNIFIYNQSPSSGNKGIACIALAIVRGRDNASENFYKKCRDLFKDYAFQQTVMCNIIHQNEVLPETYLEFRLWTQGRVNIDSLSQKLKNATSQAIWDIITEYHLLKSPLCENFTYQHKQPTKLFTTPPDPPTIKEYDISDLLDLSLTNHNVDVSITKSKLRNDHIYSQKRPKKRVGLSVNFSENPETPQKERLQLSEWELGEAGILSKIYAKHLQEWLDFGCSIDAPTVKKHTVTLSSRHLTNVIVREILAIVQQLSRDSPKAFKRLVQEGDEGKVVYVPFMVSSRFPQRCLVVSRNFEQWKACSDFRGSLDYPELFHANHLKNMQKFSPCVVNGLFVPRQNVFMALVDNDQIVCYAYNWSKDSGDKLLEYLTNLGLWLSVRSGFLYSVVYQKLGMFHNQPLTRKHFLSVNSPFIGMIVDVEMLHKFPKDRSRRIGNMTPDVLETFRDHYHPFKYTSQDPIIVFAIQMLEVKHSEKRYREELKKLHTMYQTRTSNCSSNQINMLMQNSRIIHFCHTPLLFLPRWRLQAAATRDQSLMDSDNFIVSPAVSANENVEQWHRELCYVFLCEYRRYLQTMGFMPLQIDLVLSKKALKSSGFNSDVAYFNQKAILGGILVFTMQLREPFFITKLYAIECNRLQTCTSRASTNRFTLSFLDECDRIKILMHLHSFTYDFHLRCIHSYLSNNTSYYKICEEYHITHFLDDFMKYYSKAPNFAVNLIHADTITLRNLMTEGKQLYDYLLANINQYNFEVFVMTREDWKPNEYILVQVGNTQQISYKDAQNRQCTDDFNITVIVCNVCPPFTSYDNVLHLRYYLILTSKSEIYPKTDVEQKLGKFRTVSYTRSTSNCCELLEKSITEERNSNVPSSTDTEFETSTSIESSQTLSFDDKRRGERLQDNSTPEIQQESVNYLGYYSSHEQLMQQLILDYAKVTQDQIKEMVGKGMVHCRTHLLWNKLVAPQDCQSLTYAEFMELKGLARLHNLCDIRPNLGALLNQPLTWYQGLSKLLLTKYVDHNRIYVSADGNIQHYVILHPRYVGAFMLLSMDLHTSRGDLYAVYREPQKYEDSRVCVDDRKDLLEGFINCVCFYLWSGMI